MLKGKRFQDNQSHKIVTVLDDNGSWVSLDDGSNIKSNIFTQKFSEFLEPDNFFTTDNLVMENLAQQFSQQINLNTVPVVNQDGSTISYNNPNSKISNPSTAPAGYFVDESQLNTEEMKRELLDKFNNTYVPPTEMNEAIDMSRIGQPENQYQPPMQPRQRQVYIPPEESETIVKDAHTGVVIMEPTVHQASYTESTSQPQKPQDDIYKIYQNNQDQFQTQPRPVEQRPVEQPIQPQHDPNKGMRGHDDSGFAGKPENFENFDNYYKENHGVKGVDGIVDPDEESFTFFRRFKKVHPVKINASFDEMIAEPNYVRQTALNFEGDIIKFYTKELMKKIWSNPSLLENQIYENLKIIIMGKPEIPDIDFHKFVSEETFSTKEESSNTDKIVVPTKVVKRKKNTLKNEA